MIDSHCHLNFHAFEKDVDAVIQEATSAGITKIINAGTQIGSSQWAVDLAKKYEQLYAVVAIHPHHADKLQANWLEALEKIAMQPKVIGIGECGLDYYNYKSNGIVDPKLQKEVFIQQLELAHKLHLPLQIHSRDEGARKDILEILKTHKHLLQSVPGMFHCMAGSLESLKTVLNLGFFVGFDGNITYGGVAPGEPLDLIELVQYAPLEQMVIETDSPYLTPKPHRGKRNEPRYAIITAQFIAQKKGISFEEVVAQTDKNVYTIFSKLKV